MPPHFRRDLSWPSVVVVFALQALLPAAVRAQSASEPPAPSAPPPQTAGQDAEARQLFDAGTVAFREGRYENALDYLERAYELSPRPALLFNIGTTLERLQRDEDAVVAYERYLAEEPEAANRADVESRMRHLRTAIADRSASREPPPASYDPTPWFLVGSGALVVIAGRSADWTVGGGCVGRWTSTCG